MLKETLPQITHINRHHSLGVNKSVRPSVSPSADIYVRPCEYKENMWKVYKTNFVVSIRNPFLFTSISGISFAVCLSVRPSIYQQSHFVHIYNKLWCGFNGSRFCSFISLGFEKLLTVSLLTHQLSKPLKPLTTARWHLHLQGPTTIITNYVD